MMPYFQKWPNIWLQLFLVLIAAAATTAADKQPTSSSQLLRMCRGEAPLKTRRDAKLLTWLVHASGEGSLLLEESSPHKAACWMLYKDKKKSKQRNQQQFLQRYALATLHFATTKSNTTQWDWKMAPNTKTGGNWMKTNVHECQWFGVQCNWKKQIVEIDLGFLKLDGLLPRELSLLTSLRELDLHGNDLQGVLPYKMLDRLSKLEYLRLHMNGFFGGIAREIVGLKSLKVLSFFGNYMGGSIPAELSKLSKLEMLDLYANQLTGTIPKELANLKHLKVLDVHDNDIKGAMPKEICDMKLEQLVADCLGPRPEVICDCCTICCRGIPEEPTCIHVLTGALVEWNKI